MDCQSTSERNAIDVNPIRKTTAHCRSTQFLDAIEEKSRVEIGAQKMNSGPCSIESNPNLMTHSVVSTIEINRPHKARTINDFFVPRAELLTLPNS